MLALYPRGDEGGHYRVEFFESYDALCQRIQELRWPSFTVSTINHKLFFDTHKWRDIWFSNGGWNALQRGFVPDTLLQSGDITGDREGHHIQYKRGTRLITRFVWFHKPIVSTFNDLQVSDLNKEEH